MYKRGDNEKYSIMTISDASLHKRSQNLLLKNVLLSSTGSFTPFVAFIGSSDACLLVQIVSFSLEKFETLRMILEVFSWKTTSYVGWEEVSY